MGDGTRSTLRYLALYGGTVLLLTGLLYILWDFFVSDDEIPLSVNEQNVEVFTPNSTEGISSERAVPLWLHCLNPTCLSEEEVKEEIPAPSHLVIDSIGVDHPIIPVGLNPDGSMEIPHDVNEIGWYEPGIKPGELGSAVLAGHVDSAEQGPGALFDLRLIEIDAEIATTDEAGITRTWTVTEIRRYNKNDIPLEDIFRWEGEQRDLVLITCGGEFDRTARSYEDNIVVYASPNEDT